MTAITGSSKQYIGLVDMLCEGPIYGLVEGKNSVYLDDVPFETSTSIGSFTSSSTSSASPIITSFESDGKTANVNNLALSSAAVGKYALVQVEKISAANLTITGNASYMGVTSITMDRTDGGSFGTEWNSHANNNYIVSLRNGAGQTIQLGGIVQDTDTIQLIGYGGIFWNFRSGSRAWSLQLQQYSKIVSVTGTTQFTTADVIDNHASLTNVPFVIQDTVTIDPTVPDATGTVSKVEGSTLQFRRGLQVQPPIQQVHGVSGGVTRVGNSAVVEIRQINSTSTINTYTSGTYITPNTNGYPETQSLSKDGDATPKVFAASAFGVSGSQISQTDEINLRISYNALITQNNENGDKEFAHAIYVFEVRTKYGSTGGTSDDETSTGGWSNWRRLFSQHGGFVTHRGKTTSAVAFDHTIGLQRFAPFDDFEIRITRLTRHAGLPVWSDGRTGPNGQNRTDKDKWSLQASANTGGANLSATLKDKFSYPNTAIAAVSFSSKTYSNLPKRSYHLRGLHVKIPDSYTPREYSETGVAEYDDLWTGNFRNDLYYTDNPAWVFYDIVTNNRYGAGRWLEELNINKFALYRIAKYCDELVDDGNGGTEPRFRANVYLAKSTDVYKVLKDMATIFTGMLYWLDGQLTAVQDVPSDPIYTFTKGNVIDGKFNYESSGRKTRSNQVVVTWNDPKLNYEPSALIVEDREDIVRTRKIISQNSVAMGATSEGQALRYGRWKLWTAQNQKEVVSFETGLQGAFIRPGDVVNVQDRDRYGVDYSGLIKSVDASTPSIVLDRLITNVANVGSLKLHTLVTSYAAFYTGLNLIRLDSNGDTTQSTGVNYDRGDILNAQQVYVATGPGTYTRQSILNEEDASNAFYKSGSDYIPLQVDWKPHSYVVTKNVGSTQTTNGLTEVVVDSAWGTEIPAAGSVWALSAEDANGVGILGSKKEYRVLGIAHNDNKQTYTISAVEHYNIKYDAVDKDYDLGIVTNQAYAQIEDPTVDVPAPENVYVVLESDKTKDGEEIRLEWTKPQQNVTVVNTANVAVIDKKDYEFLNGYEVHHNIDYLDSPIFTSNNSYRFDGLKNSNYVFRVRTVSRKGNYSEYVTTSISTDDPFSTNVPRVVGGLPKGVFSTDTAVLNHDSTLTNEEDRYVVTWPRGNSVKVKSVANEFQGNGTAAGAVKLFGLAQSGIIAHSPPNSGIVDSIALDGVGGDTNWHYLLYDGAAYLADWNSVTLDNLPFMNKLSGNTGFEWRGSPQSWTYTASLGTVAAGTNVLKRTSGTGFLTSLELRDIIHFDGHGGDGTTSASFRMWKINHLREVGTENVVSVEVRADDSDTSSTADITDEFSNGDIITLEGVAGATDANSASVVNNQFYYVKRISGVDDRLQLYKDAALTNPLRDSGASPDISNAHTQYSGFLRKAKVKAAKVVAIVNDDTAFLDRTFESAIGTPTPIPLYKFAYRPSYSFDAVFGRVKWNSYSTSNSAHSFSLETFIIIDKGLDSSTRRVEVTPEIPVLQYTPEGVEQITQPGVISVSVAAIGFESPEFKLTSLSGAGALDFSTTTDPFVGPDTTDGFIKSFDITTEAQGNNFPWDSGEAVVITAEVREAVATGINATGTGQITKITSGSDGVDGKTVHLDSEDYSIIYDVAGLNPVFNGSSTDQNLTFTAEAFNFTNPEFKFTFNGSLLQSTTNFTQTGFGSFAAGTNNQATATVAVPNQFTNNWNNSNEQRTFSVKVEVREAATAETAAGDVQALDEVNVIGVHANKDGYWAIVSNPGHTIATDVEGVPIGTDVSGYVSVQGSGTTIEVGRGGTVLKPYQGTTTAWNALSYENQVDFYHVTFSKSPTNSTFNIGATTFPTNYMLSLGDHEFSTGWNTESAALGFAIELENTGDTINLSQSFSKSKQGFGGIFVSNSNSFESLPVDPVNKRPFDYAATATTLNVFMSGINLPYYKSGATIPSSVLAYWQFSTIADDTNITAGTVNDSSMTNGSTGALSIPKASNMTGDTASITWQLAVNIRGADGAFNTEYVTTTQNLRKNSTNANISAFLNINHYVFDGDTTTSSPAATSYTLSALSKYVGSGDDPINPYITYQQTGGTETEFTTNTENSGATKTTSTESFTRPAYSTSGSLNYPITYTVRLYDWDGTTGTLAGNGVLLDEDTVSLSASRTPADNVVIELTNENETVASTNPDANLTGSPLATTTANIYIGGVLSNSGWTFTKSTLSGVTASFDSTNTNQLNITQVNSGFTSGQITITATHSSYSTHQAVFTLSRTNDGVSYRIVPDVSAVSYNPNDSSYTPSNATVNFAFKKITGGVSSAFTGGAYKIDNGTAVTGSSSASHTFTATAPSSVNVKLYSNSGATQLVDEETIPLIIGGEDGVSLTSTQEYYKLTNSATAPSRYSTGTTIDTGWTTTPPQPTSSNKYLWNFNRNTKSDGSTEDTNVILLSTLVKSIASITEAYQVHNSPTAANTSGTWYSTIAAAVAAQEITSSYPYLWNRTTIAYTDGSTSTVVYSLIAVRGNDGVSFSGTVEYYKIHNSKTNAPARYSSGTTIASGWNTTPATPTTANRYTWNFNRSTKSDSTFTDSQPVLVSELLKSISSITEEYQKGSSATTAPTGTWYSTIAAAGSIDATNPYMWNRTTIAYTDGSTSTVTTTVIAARGSDGVSYTGTAEYYKLTNTNAAPGRYSSGTTIAAGWSTSPSTPTSTNQYLWNFNRNSKSDGTFQDSAVYLITQFVQDGKGISSITEHYALHTSASSAPSSGWSSAFPTISASYPYIWNRTLINYTDGTNSGYIYTLVAARGTNGSTPVKGVDYDDGDPGDDAGRVVTGYIYSANSNPTVPSSQTYNFSYSGTDSAFSSITGWSTNPPTFNSTNSTIFYASYTAVETVTNGNATGSGTVTFSSRQTGTSFTGLVTFHSGGGAGDGAFSTDGGSNFTTIDGGNISTGSITTTSLEIADRTIGSTTSQLKLYTDALKIFDGGSLRVKLGNLSNTTDE